MASAPTMSNSMLNGIDRAASSGLRIPQITISTALVRQICQMATPFIMLACSMRARAVPKKMTMPAISEKADSGV